MDRHKRTTAPTKPDASQMQIAAFADPAFKLHRIVDAITHQPLLLLANNQLKPGDDLDLRPFAKLFDSTIDDLTRLRKRVHREIDDLEDQLAAQELSSMTKLSDLGQTFATVSSCFDTLESRVSEVGTTAIRIGEQLETIDKQRSKAAEFRELLIFLLDLNKGSLKLLEDLMAEKPDGQVRTAVIARRLQHVLKDIDSTSTHTAKSTIDGFCDRFESDLLRAFEKAVNDSNVDVLKQITAVLFEFNGGESAVRVFINRHPLFTDLGSVNDPALSKNNLLGEPGLRRLFEQLRATVYQDWDLISKVFASPISVLSQLIQRFFQQVVQSHLDVMLQEAAKTSTTKYLNTLSNVEKMARTLIKDVGHFDTTVLQRPGVVARVIEQAVEEQFVRFRSSIDREISHLESLMQTLFKDAHAYYTARKQQKKSMFSRIQKSSTGPSTLEHQLSSDAVMEILHAHTQAMDRCLQLHSDPVPVIAKLHGVLCQHIYVGYVQVALDATWDEVAGMDGARGEPDLKVLATVHMANTVVQLLQVHFETRTTPVLVASPTVHRTVMDLKNTMVANLEAQSSAICEHLLACTVAYTLQALGKQKKTDYRSRGDDEIDIMDQLNSQACIAVCEFISKVATHLKTFLDGDNRHAFAVQFGTHVHKQLLDHFKKFPVSTNGALSLSRDISKYQQTISLLQVGELVDRFEMLREFGHLFLVRPENLPSILSEGVLAQMDSGTLQAYLANRADYKTARIEEMLHERGQFGANVSATEHRAASSSIQSLNSGLQGNISMSISSLHIL